jgi:hypothetical protein
MDFKDLFPSWKCSAEEFGELFPKGSALTVERIETRKQAGRGGGGGGEAGDGEQYAICYFEELRKPISLNKGNAQAIMQQAGTSVVDDWSGVVVFVLTQPFEYTDDYGERRFTHVFRIYPNSKNAVPELAAKSDLTRLIAAKRRKELQAKPAAPALNSPPVVKIGFDRAVKMVGLMRQRNLNWADVLSYAQDNDTLHHVEGVGDGSVLPPDLTDHGAKVVAALIKHRPATTQVQWDKLEAELRQQWYPPKKPATGEVIDPTTGEVLNPAGVTEDDIPF